MGWGGNDCMQWPIIMDEDANFHLGARWMGKCCYICIVKKPLGSHWMCRMPVKTDVVPHSICLVMESTKDKPNAEFARKKSLLTLKGFIYPVSYHRHVFCHGRVGYKNHLQPRQLGTMWNSNIYILLNQIKQFCRKRKPPIKTAGIKFQAKTQL